MTSQAITFDTFKVIKKLKRAGFSEEQAEVQAGVLNCALSEFQNNKLQELAKKGNIVAVKGDIAALKSKTIKWVAGLLIAQQNFLFCNGL